MSSLPYTLQQMNAATKSVIDMSMSLGDHDMALTALLSAYATIADAHPCCTETCARMTANLSKLLFDVVAARNAAKH